MSRDALVVGINQYNFSGLSTLRSPALDAEMIAKRLSEAGNFHVKRLPQFLDPFEDNAPRISPKQEVKLADLKDALEELFYPEGQSIPDSALFYFSGHGLRTGRRIKEGFLATSDTNPDAGNWGLSLKWLRELLKESPVRQQIIWLDCCFSGELLNFTEADPGERGNTRDRCFIAASREFEPAYENVGGVSSVLTNAILRGFNLANVSNQWVTNETLVAFLREELKTASQKFISNNLGCINIICKTEITNKQDIQAAAPTANQRNKTAKLAEQLRAWFTALRYDFEQYEINNETYFEWIINIINPIGRKRYNRILVRGITGEAEMKDVAALRKSVNSQRTDIGWLITNRRVSRAAKDEVSKQENQELFCYTLDELLDRDADFSGYLNWLEDEIKQRGIDRTYVPLTCTKEEFDPISKQKMGISCYGETDGWIDGYVDRWLDDPAKEHLSILGEFGTGKTWFGLHYAWTALQRYRDAQRRGVERPRLPLVIPLRDYAKAVSVESLFSEFFFRKHEIPLPGYSAFEQLNRMGKVLLIFDGFDEMAARVNRQQMINNFWELAKVVVPGAKVILTCRTEHFPEAKQGRALLSAELQASTINLPLETPRFEVLELEKFDDEQIRQVLAFRTEPETVKRVMNNSTLRDLARRPVMTELIIEALPEIEAGKPVDISRVYLYAVRHKMERDIKAERTFTSLADKLYFLCELSWEMLSTDKMSMNYKEFPDRIRSLFGFVVQEEKNLDYWHYDMMGQTMLIRNAEGDYSPAHRSLLEFFAAYKLVAELGVLASDFTEIAQTQSCLDNTLLARDYTWSEYFHRLCKEDGQPLAIAPLKSFTNASLERLYNYLGKAPLAKATLDLAMPMLDKQLFQQQLLSLIHLTRGKTQAKVGCTGGNLAKLLLEANPYGLEKCDLCDTVITDVNFANASLRWINLMGADLTNSLFSPVLGTVWSIAFSPDGKKLVIGDGKGTVQVWETSSGKLLLFLQGHEFSVMSVAFSPDGQFIISGSLDQTLRLWDLNGNLIGQPFIGHDDLVISVTFSSDGQFIASSSQDKTIRLWNLNGSLISQPFIGHEDAVNSVAFSPDSQYIISGSDDKTLRLWDLNGNLIGQPFIGHENAIYSVKFSPNGQCIISGSGDGTLRLWDINGQSIGQPFIGHEKGVYSVAFSPNGKLIASVSNDKTARLWDLNGNPVGQPFIGHEEILRTVTFSPDGQNIVTGGWDNTVRLWDLDGNSLGQSFVGYDLIVWEVGFSPNGQRIVAGSKDKTVRLWDLNGNPVGQPFIGHENVVRSVVFSPNGQLIVSGSDDKTLRLWDLNGTLIGQPFVGHEDVVRSVAFSPNGQLIVSGSWDKTVRLWDLNGTLIGQPFVGHNSAILSVAFSPDGQRIVTSSADTTIRLWDVNGSPIAQPFMGHRREVYSVAFSPCGRQIVSGSWDKTVRLWDVNGNPIGQPFIGHDREVYSVAFSPCGRQIVSGSWDKTVRLWDVNGNPIGQPFIGHQERVISVGFSPDGQHIVSSSNDETIRIWEVKTGKCLQVINYKLCAGLNITGVTGLTSAQRVALKLMGAIDNS
ncbi:NACHT domain-containing protein (plasmid) [Nostoc sp. C052]|uniref:caspase family protein n=1 Tax=Nostoc sp. C052 TaxID=2576902 RepID=UPI0015C2C896|nr:caspase family protein [Nostoc sp. C052]QLE45293.1 NACHT domain-containing protein [Nostoc sp. C052]